MEVFSEEDPVRQLFEQGIAFYKAGDYIKFNEAFQQVARLKPDYAEAYNYLGATYGILGKF